MSNRYFFIGRAERIVISILLLLAISGFALYSLSRNGTQRKSDYEASQSTQSIGMDTLHRNRHYVGPPAHMKQSQIKKFDKRILLDLNAVDSLTLLRIPGIGPAFAGRILRLRETLGGYYTVMQLQEVFGMTEDKYLALRGWFRIGKPPKRFALSELKPDELPKHPYLNPKQYKAMNRLLYRQGTIRRWSQLMQDEAFTKDDSTRLSHYFYELVANPSSSTPE